MITDGEREEHTSRALAQRSRRGFGGTSREARDEVRTWSRRLRLSSCPARTYPPCAPSRAAATKRINAAGPKGPHQPATLYCCPSQSSRTPGSCRTPHTLPLRAIASDRGWVQRLVFRSHKGRERVARLDKPLAASRIRRRSNVQQLLERQGGLCASLVRAGKRGLNGSASRHKLPIIESINSQLISLRTFALTEADSSCSKPS